jgi:PAS domain S-box-containing protein
MRENLRRSGIDIIGDVPWGTHICQFYETKDDLTDILVPYFKVGLENNEFCLWVTSQPLEVEDAKEILRKAVPDLDYYLGKGQIEIIPYTCLHVTGSICDSEKVINYWVGKLNHALENGYEGLRLNGNTSWLEKRDWGFFVDYMGEMDDIIGDYRIIALGSYFIDNYGAAEIIEVVSNHQFSLTKREGKWEKIDNFGRKKAEEEAFRAAKDWEHTFDVVPDLIDIIDDKYRVVRANKAMATRLRVTPEECVGLTCYRVVHGTDVPPSFCPHRQLLKDELEHTKEVHEDGLGGNFVVSVSPLHHSEGKLVGCIHVARDINERKEAEEALKKANDSLEEKVKERTTELEKAYNSLKESEEGLAEAQKMAHIGNWEWVIATDKAYWSDELYRIYGRNPQESAPSYSEYLDYAHPDDRDYLSNAFKEAAVSGKPYNIDHRIILANGEERTVHIQSKVISDDTGNPFRVQGIVQDITERRSDEEKIQNLANIVESSNDAIITKSLDGIITSWNKGAEQVYGYSAKEIIGKPISIIEPCSIKREIEKLGEMIKQGNKIQNYETSRLRKDGTIINVSMTLSPVFDASGKLVAISAIARDITERKRAEEALRESEARLRRFYESGIFGVLYYNPDGFITDANDKFLEIVGYTREDLKAGRIRWDKMTPPEYRYLDEHAIAELKATGVSSQFEKEYTRKDGSRIPVIVGIATFDPVRNEGIAFVLDITERKKAEKALEKAEDARKKEIHHRIKNNLQVISSLLDLQAEKFSDEKVIEAFRESQNRVISMALIHEELYEGEGTDTLNFSEYIKKLADNLFKTYRLCGKNIHLYMDMEENTFINMDTAVPLGIIVNELVSNSLKHAFSGRDRGEIRIKLRRDENGEFISREESKSEVSKSTSFILIVSDNGTGIPEDLNIEDFDSLGLQLVSSLIDQLDGELELKRNNGTEFIMKYKVTEK